jgi:hypothetical protein
MMPARNSWVPHIIKKHNRIIADVTKHYHKQNFKFGIEVPKTYTLWQDAVKREMKNVRISLKIINGDEAILPMYQEITCHMVFDVKMEDFWRNDNFVPGGHKMDILHTMIYTSVMLQE